MNEYGNLLDISNWLQQIHNRKTKPKRMIRRQKNCPLFILGLLRLCQNRIATFLNVKQSQEKQTLETSYQKKIIQYFIVKTCACHKRYNWIM